MSDWRVGDLALCVDGLFFNEDGSHATQCPQEGKVYTVTGTGTYGPIVWIDLRGFGDLGCDAAQFRKILPDKHETGRECEQLLALLRQAKKPVSA